MAAGTLSAPPLPPLASPPSFDAPAGFAPPPSAWVWEFFSHISLILRWSFMASSWGGVVLSPSPAAFWGAVILISLNAMILLEKINDFVRI